MLLHIAKVVGFISKTINLGAGGTWPGEVALRLNPGILSSLARQLPEGVILVAGTNGKTTTAKMVEYLLSKYPNNSHSRSPSQLCQGPIPSGTGQGFTGQVSHLEGVRVVHNASGANLLNGITSALIQAADIWGRVKADIGVFEVDEVTLPLALKEVTPRVVVLLNLFRDQLDRYGEVDVVAEKWLKALNLLEKDTTAIINADDPHLAFIGTKLRTKVYYFGLGNPKYFLDSIPHAVDTIYCSSCGSRLVFTGVYLSHLGEWRCLQCPLRHPKNDITAQNIVGILRRMPLHGIYNLYNVMAAVLTVQSLKDDVKDTWLISSLENFQPAFGRQEGLVIDGKKIKILLSKNPAGFNASLQTVFELMRRRIGQSSPLLLVLNDRIPDGLDVSWIWDVDFEIIPGNIPVIVSGDRVFDMALRIKYASKVKNQKYNLQLKAFENLKEAIHFGLNNVRSGETLYVLPTYSAMLEVRKILKGRKIL